jgi:hypothetical protein
MSDRFHHVLVSSSYFPRKQAHGPTINFKHICVPMAPQFVAPRKTWLHAWSRVKPKPSRRSLPFPFQIYWRASLSKYIPPLSYPAGDFFYLFNIWFPFLPPTRQTGRGGQYLFSNSVWRTIFSFLPLQDCARATHLCKVAQFVIGHKPLQ